MKTEFSIPITELTPNRVKPTEFYRYINGENGIVAKDGYAFKQINELSGIEKTIIVQRTSVNNYRCALINGNNLSFFQANNYEQIHSWLRVNGVAHRPQWMKL